MKVAPTTNLLWDPRLRELLTRSLAASTTTKTIITNTVIMIKPTVTVTTTATVTALTETMHTFLAPVLVLRLMEDPLAVKMIATLMKALTDLALILAPTTVKEILVVKIQVPTVLLMPVHTNQI